MVVVPLKVVLRLVVVHPVVVVVPAVGRRDSLAGSLNRNLIQNYQIPHYLDTVAGTAGDSAGLAGSRDGAGNQDTGDDHRTYRDAVRNQAVDSQGVMGNHLNFIVNQKRKNKLKKQLSKNLLP